MLVIGCHMLRPLPPSGCVAVAYVPRIQGDRQSATAAPSGIGNLTRVQISIYKDSFVILMTVLRNICHALRVYPPSPKSTFLCIASAEIREELRKRRFEARFVGHWSY